jgi:hypothetical protein
MQKHFAVLPPSVNNENAGAGYTNSQLSYNNILGARAGIIIGLVLTLVLVVLCGIVYWQHSKLEAKLPMISLVVLSMAFGQFLFSCITVGCFKAALASQESYLSSGNHWSTGTGLALNIVALVHSIAALGLAAIAALDARGLPPSKWSAALREKTLGGGAGDQLYEPLDGNSAQAPPPAPIGPHRETIDRGGALPAI